MPCSLHLIRHAEHVLQGHALVGRTPAVPLSTAGQAQVAALVRLYRSIPLDAVLTSPVQRAQDTAGPVAAARGLPAEVDPGLDEVDFGRWTGQAFTALEGDPAWAAWNTARALSRTPGGETMLAVQARALVTVLAAAARHPDGTVLCVSHADVIKAVLAAALGMPLDLLHRIELAPGHRAVLLLGDGWARVDGVNLPA